MPYNAFISYSHAADGRLAPALQAGLQRLAKPWNRRRALNIFRDDTGLSVSHALWPSIQAALDDAEWFVFLASPEATASEWVTREITHWLVTKPHDRILPVLTGGALVWDAEQGGYDPARSTAASPALLAAFSEEPRHLDLTWARGETDLNLRNSRFRAAIAELAAPMHGMPKDELEGEDIRQHRRSLRLRNAAVIGLGTLTILTSVGAVTTYLSRNEAVRQANIAREQKTLAEERARIATSRALAAGALTEIDLRHDRALLLAAQAVDIDPTPETRDVLMTTLAARPRLIGYRHGPPSPVRHLAFAADGTRLVAAHDDGTLKLWSADAPTPVELTTEGGIGALALDSAGDIVTTFGVDGVLQRHDRSGGMSQIWKHGAAKAVALSQDGRVFAQMWDNRLVAGRVGNGPTLEVETECGWGHGDHVPLTINTNGSRIFCGESVFSMGKHLRKIDGPRFDVSFGMTALSVAPKGHVMMGEKNGDLEIATLFEGNYRVETLKQGFVDDRGAGAYLAPQVIAATWFDDTLMTATDRGTLDAWTFGSRLETIPLGAASATALSGAPGQGLIAAGLEDGRIALLDVGAVRYIRLKTPAAPAASTPGMVWAGNTATDSWGDPLARVVDKFDVGQGRIVAGRALSADGMRVAAGQGAHVAVWDLARADMDFGLGGCATIELSPYALLSATLSPSGARAACWAKAGGVILHNAAGDRRIKDVRQPLQFVDEDTVLLLAHRQDDAGQNIPRLTIRDARTGKAVTTQSWSAVDLPGACWDPKLALVAGRLVYATEAGVRLGVSGALSDAVIATKGCANDLALTPDGRRLAVATRDGGLTIWDTEARTLAARLIGHRAPVLALGLSADGTVLVSGDEAGDVRLWSTATGRAIGGALRMQHVGVLAVAVDTEVGRVVSTSGEDTVIWEFGVDGSTARACTAAGRLMTAEERASYLETAETPFDACDRY